MEHGFAHFAFYFWSGSKEDRSADRLLRIKISFANTGSFVEQ